ncbi:ABC transporter ATP-binding protein [Amycolatopsis anabasis]|uniref:ABC transporter ATP-binding protein n=1 Tax=Amycolatopsis anabasis TaxID=1840409 RepID=UPI00131D6AE2|nr:ABC transporter ATP-binding protein [Amycolatopsis anabasis]
MGIELSEIVQPRRAADDPVSTEAVTKRYGTRAAVDGVSLRVTGGQVFGLLGPNGAGKTTLLRMLLGLVRPTTGKVAVFGEPPPRTLARVGALIEGPGMYPYLSGRDNLRVLARQAGAPVAKVDEVLDRVGLSARARDRTREYSLGMKQRLGVAASLLKNPDLLVLDEPTNGLDPQGVLDMRDLVRRLGEDGHTVLLSSHLLAEVEEVCDRVAVLARGRIVREGTVGELRGRGVVVVHAEPVGRALALAAEPLGERVKATAGRLEAEIEDHEIPGLVALLTGHDIDVFGVRRRESSLEEVFLTLTNEGDDHDQR